MVKPHNFIPIKDPKVGQLVKLAQPHRWDWHHQVAGLPVSYKEFINKIGEIISVHDEIAVVWFPELQVFNSWNTGNLALWSEIGEQKYVY